MENNQIRTFQCSQCRKPKLVLKKVADQQHRGFACEKCWTTIETRSRYGGGCLMQ
jgi:transcription elongation factor Elf1